MSKIKHKEADIKKIGFRVIRLGEAYYSCTGYVTSEKKNIKLFPCDKDGNITSAGNITISLPLNIPDPSKFEILQK